MAALTIKRMKRETRYKNVPLPLGAGEKVYEGGIACADTSAGVVKKGAAGNANLLRIGEFMEDYDNSAGAAGAINALVSLDHEVVARWYDNATGGNAVTTAHLFQDVYILDDHTVTTASSGNSKAGRVWAVSATDGVAVETYTL